MSVWNRRPASTGCPFRYLQSQWGKHQNHHQIKIHNHQIKIINDHQIYLFQTIYITDVEIAHKRNSILSIFLHKILPKKIPSLLPPFTQTKITGNVLVYSTSFVYTQTSDTGQGKLWSLALIWLVKHIWMTYMYTQTSDTGLGKLWSLALIWLVNHIWMTYMYNVVEWDTGILLVNCYLINI